MAMSDAHKAALKQGRLEAREITTYLSALGSRRRGHPALLAIGRLDARGNGAR